MTGFCEKNKGSRSCTSKKAQLSAPGPKDGLDGGTLGSFTINSDPLPQIKTDSNMNLCGSRSKILAINELHSTKFDDWFLPIVQKCINHWHPTNPQNELNSLAHFENTNTKNGEKHTLERLFQKPQKVVSPRTVSNMAYQLGVNVSFRDKKKWVPNRNKNFRKIYNCVKNEHWLFVYEWGRHVRK